MTDKAAGDSVGDEHAVGGIKNPKGLGDPEDRRLRKVEKDVMVPMKIRDKTKELKCVEEVRAFHECCKDWSMAMVAMCRQQNTVMKDCLTRWYQDPGFIKECEEEYLCERSEYRRTGIKQKSKRATSSTH